MHRHRSASLTREDEILIAGPLATPIACHQRNALIEIRALKGQGNLLAMSRAPNRFSRSHRFKYAAAIARRSGARRRCHFAPAQRTISRA